MSYRTSASLLACDTTVMPPLFLSWSVRDDRMVPADRRRACSFTISGRLPGILAALRGNSLVAGAVATAESGHG